MPQTFNLYCDESCHLEHDNSKVMVLGAVWCPLEKVREIAERLREIKIACGLSPSFEVKWNKVSPAKVGFYRSILDYFFDDDDLHFRAIVVEDKSKLRHGDFGQDHDTWYYKMLSTLLEPLLSPAAAHRIYLDKKDTRSAEKVTKLHEVLCNSRHDFDRHIVERLQSVRSHEVEQLQLADLLLGTVCYANRQLKESSAKLALVERMRKRSGYSLTKTTLLREHKTNIFVWSAREPG